MKPMKKQKCIQSGQIDSAYGAQIVYHCSCGASMYVQPKKDRRVAGEIVPGYSVRIPSHKEGSVK